MSRWKAVLIGSLLLNLFLASGLVGGVVWLGSGDRMIAAGALRVAGSELPGAERRAFRAALRSARASARPLMIRSDAAKMEAATLLVQPVAEPSAIGTALARARADDLRVRAIVEDRAVAYAVTLPRADRKRISDALLGRMRQRQR